MFRAIFAFLLASYSAFAQEPTNCTSIHFPPGAFSTTVSSRVGSDEPFPCYTLATARGQTANLKFTKTNGNMGFSIYDVIDDCDAYSFKTQAKTYKFIVFQTLRASGADPFSLLISVK